MKPNLKSLKTILDEYFMEKDARKDAYGALLRISEEINRFDAELREILTSYKDPEKTARQLAKEILGE